MDTSRINEIFKPWDKPDSPGCMLAIIKDGEFVHKRGYGMADLERGVPISSVSVFDLGSAGKQFTATVIAILANQGLLGLDDPIRNYLPEMPGYAEQITIRHLLHHTSGLRDYLTLMDLRGMIWENLYSEELLLDLIARQQGLNFEPGSEYLYSNSGYFLLGTIAQRVAGKHITTLISEHILVPLGMTHTTFNKDFRPLVPQRALSYDPGEAEGTFINALALSGGFGDGALLSSVDDLLLWDRNFYANKLNNAQPDLIAQLEQTGVLNNSKPITYAFGLDVSTYKGQKVVQHGGSWAGYRAQFMQFPGLRTTFICLCNLGNMDPGTLCAQVADVVLEDVLFKEKTRRAPKATAATEPSATELQTMTGVYQDKQQTFEILLKDSQLHFSHNAQAHPLKLVGKKKYQIAEFPLYLKYSGPHNEHIQKIRENKTDKLVRVRTGRFVPPTLTSYVGEYYSAELDINYSITEKDGALQLKRHPFDELQPVTFFTENALRARIGELRLRFSKDGSVKGFNLNAGRVINIKFRKRT